MFAVEIEKCEMCGGKVKIIVDTSNRTIEDSDVIEKILKHLGLDEASETRARSPPVSLFGYSSQLF